MWPHPQILLRKRATEVRSNVWRCDDRATTVWDVAEVRTWCVRLVHRVARARVHDRRSVEHHGSTAIRYRVGRVERGRDRRPVEITVRRVERGVYLRVL